MNATKTEGMSYSRYFKSGQKVLLTANTADPVTGWTDSLTTYFQGAGSNYFDLTLPYGGTEDESYPFAADMPFVINSEAFGLGLKLSGQFASRVGKDVIRINVAHDLQVFQRRNVPRIEVEAGVRYTKGRGTLRTFHKQWEKNIRILRSGQSLSKLGSFPRRPINLSASGVRFDVKKPVDIADLCLVLIDLDGAPPICALSEVVWTRETEDVERFTTGMRFVSLLDSDLKRLENFVENVQRTAPGKN